MSKFEVCLWCNCRQMSYSIFYGSERTGYTMNKDFDSIREAYEDFQKPPEDKTYFSRPHRDKPEPFGVHVHKGWVKIYDITECNNLESVLDTVNADRVMKEIIV